MSAPFKNVTIIGGGGNLGQIILRGLISAPQFSITALKRPGSTATFPTAANLKVVETEFSPESLVSNFKGQDVVISVIGGMGLGEQIAIIDAAVKAGVKRFFPSEFGINGRSKAVRELTPFFAVKQQVLDYLVEKESEGLTWTALVVGVLFDWCLANGFLGFDLTSNKATIWDDGNTRFSTVNEDGLSEAVVASLKNPDATRNKYVYVSSVATTQNEILQALEKSTSTKWTIRQTDSQDEVNDARKALARGDFSGAFALVKASAWSNLPGLDQHFEVDEKELLLNDVLEIKSEGVQETVDRVLAGDYNGSHYA